MDTLIDKFMEEKEDIAGCTKVAVTGYELVWKAFKRYSGEFTPEGCN
jgi:hypothetical protein